MLIQNLNNQLKALLHGPLWLDESFDKKLNSLSEDDAFKKPSPDIHSVAELLSHLNVWIVACMDRMDGRENNLDDNDENDWKKNETLRTMGWQQLKSDFYTIHNSLIQWLSEKDEEFLDKKYIKNNFTNLEVLNGLIHHDAYHMGQIGITIKLLKRKS